VFGVDDGEKRLRRCQGGKMEENKKKWKMLRLLIASLLKWTETATRRCHENFLTMKNFVRSIKQI
jgi:hypothetical protein